MRKTVPALENKYGAENCIGAMESIHTNYMSDELSDYGEGPATRAECERARDDAGLGALKTTVWMRTRVGMVSTQVSAPLDYVTRNSIDSQ